MDFPNVLIAMNGPSLDSFEASIAPGGLIIVTSSLIGRKVKGKQYIDVNLKAVEAAVHAGSRYIVSASKGTSHGGQ